MQPRRRLMVCLAGVLVGLLLVGAISGTVVRHIIQVTPILLVLLLAIWSPRLLVYFALPIFTIWILLMLLIWLYLLGIATFFSGSFSMTEIVLTLLVGGSAVAGIVECLRSRPVPISQRIVGFIAFAIVQVVALWVSFTAGIANR
jgi:hypothetical protein